MKKRLSKRKKKQTVNRVDKMMVFCKEVVSVIQKENGFSDYRIRVVYRENEGQHDEHVIARINVDNEYIRATITILPAFTEMYREKKYSELIEALCHEVFHIKMSTIDDMANNRWGSSAEAVRTEIERLTELYGRMIYRVMSMEKKFDSFKNPNGTTSNKKTK